MGNFPETSRFFYAFTMMYFCYIDESGTPQIPGNTSHYILAGFSIPIQNWKYCDQQIQKIKKKYQLENCEIHTAWLVRNYIEQSHIPGFENMDYATRIHEVGKLRKKELLRLQKSNNKKLHKQTKKNYRQTDCYIHLTHQERMRFVYEVADFIGNLKFARIFAECIDKVHFDPNRATLEVDEQGLEQLVSRFEQYLQIVGKSRSDDQIFGALIHDNNETVSRKHTDLMKRFHKDGTF